MRNIVVALICGLCVAGTSAGATSADSVTMSVRQYVNPNKVRVLQFSGQISSGTAGELVEIVGRDCLSSGVRQLLATQTAAGGGWLVENPPPQPDPYVEINSGTTIRARWKEALSAPYLYRVPLTPYPLEFTRGVVTVRVNPSPLNLKLAGKTVALQRFSANTWQPYQSARLKYKPTLDAGAYNHQAVFKVKRGLKLRALVPTVSARPCYLAGASKPFQS